MSDQSPIRRRTFLKGLGTLLALPPLESLWPARGVAGDATTLPRRMAFVFIPNGANMADWKPRKTGADFELPFILEPLAAHRKDLLILSGLAHDRARPNGDGAGDHARSSATFLTGCQARKTQGSDIRVGVSVDQIAAAEIGGETRFASLELGCDRARQTGNCDSGYSCAYSFNISWKTPSLPMPPEVNPRAAFERLFAAGTTAEITENRVRRERDEKSILDFVLDDAKRLQAKLGATDRRRLDEYLTGVRDLETRIIRSQNRAAAVVDHSMPQGVPKDYAEHLRTMFDLVTLAFQTDTTRIATLIVAHDGSNRSYPFLGVSEGHHNLSHHGGNAEKKAKLAKINRFHVTQFAYFLERLKEINEGEGTLLDQSMIVYGAGIGDGNRHNHNDLPVLLAGRGGGTIQPGRHLSLGKETPMCNLYLSMLERVGVSNERFGDSTGPLSGLS